MKSWSIVRLVAGVMVLLSLALGVAGSPLFVNPWWLALAAFAGLNLIQSSFTGWCPAEIVARKLGLAGGC
ncbi:MAG: DUF2892 domain-containing protein [Proteobacteria bacterium]|nr:DUF2892 domain-containing protein [Pseudomonadota bacterium]